MPSYLYFLMIAYLLYHKHYPKSLYWNLAQILYALNLHTLSRLSQRKKFSIIFTLQKYFARLEKTQEVPRS